MLDITSYRRKQKYAQPLTIMREFYYDYIKAQNNKASINFKHEIDPLAKRTLSVQRFNTCFIKLSKKQEKDKKLTQVLEQKNQERRQKVVSDSYRKRKLTYTIKKQSQCFKTAFTKSIPFLTPPLSIDRKISSNKLQSQPTQRQNKFQTPNILCPRKLQMNNPTKLYNQMIIQKQSMENIRLITKQKMKKNRQNWIIHNLYKKYDDKEKQVIGWQKRQRVRDMYMTTKENIFPK